YYLHFVPFTFVLTHASTTTLSTLSLHDALPIYQVGVALLEIFVEPRRQHRQRDGRRHRGDAVDLLLGEDALAARFVEHHHTDGRSEEHTSELQSHLNLVCRLLLEKKKKNHHTRQAPQPGRRIGSRKYHELESSTRPMRSETCNATACGRMLHYFQHDRTLARHARD